MKTQTIGIEIEMTGITREKAAKVAADFLKGEATRTYGVYDTYNVKAEDGRVWKVMSDSSIKTMKDENGTLRETRLKEYSVELVSPILTYGDIETLQELVRRLRKAGATSESKYKCGIHIHIGAKNHTPQSLRNLVNLMASKEDLVYKSLNINPTRMDYCKKINEELIRKINIYKPKTLEKLADVWYNGYYGARMDHYHESRYHGLYAK